MKFSGTMKGKKGALKAMERRLDAPDQVMKRLEVVGARIESEARRSVQAVSSGKRAVRYTKPKGKRTVVVSKPGDAPNTDTGQAVKSIRRVVNKSQRTVQVGTNLDYLAMLEFKSRNRAERPWLRPAFKKVLKRVGSKFFKPRFKRG